MPEPSSPKHLIVCVNGLFSCADHWHTCNTVLRQRLDSERVLIHASCVNEFRDTFEGIGCCGHRLANEITKLVKQHDSLEEISIIGHSMGGLISRYAMGLLYEAGGGMQYSSEGGMQYSSEGGTKQGGMGPVEDGDGDKGQKRGKQQGRRALVAGRLRPMHFIAIASPHCGVTAGKSPVQLPLTTWAGSFMQPLLSCIGSLIARSFLHQTGMQLFGLDRAKGKDAPPTVLTQLVLDSPKLPGLNPNQQLLCYSALSQFRTRTSYANTHGDVWVTWENGSMRERHELPEIEPSLVDQGCGVVHEAFWGGDLRPLDESTGQQQQQQQQPFLVFASDLPKNRNKEIAFCLKRLKSLSWHIVDVCFSGEMPWSAGGGPHKRIQGRGKTTPGGMSVVHHLADLLAYRLEEDQQGAAPSPLPKRGAAYLHHGFESTGAASAALWNAEVAGGLPA